MLDNASPAGHIMDDFQLVFAPLRSVRFLVTVVVSVGVPTTGDQSKILFAIVSRGDDNTRSDIFEEEVLFCVVAGCNEIPGAGDG